MKNVHKNSFWNRLYMLSKADVAMVCSLSCPPYMVMVSLNSFTLPWQTRTTVSPHMNGNSPAGARTVRAGSESHPPLH